jgi:hypothetical protein
MTRSKRDRRQAATEDAELDALLTGAWDHAAAIVGRLLDLDEGREALLATASGDNAGDPAAKPGGALRVVLTQADAMLNVITPHLAADQGPAHTHIATFLRTSRHYLLRLRAGLAQRTLTREAAWNQLAGLDHALKEAGRTLMALPAGTVTDDERYDLGALVAGLRAGIPELGDRIERLFDDAGHVSVPVPVS